MRRGVRMDRRGIACPLVGAHLLATALFLTACGGDYTFVVEPPHGEPSFIAATYDITAAYGDLFFPEFPATGLSLDMTLEIDPNSLGDPSGSLSGTVRIVEATVGGLPRAFDPVTPIPISGRLAGDQIDLLPFGPVTVGSTYLFPDLTGILAPDGRRMDGLARLGNLPDEGTWLGIKQRRYLIAGSDYSIFGAASVVTVRYGTRFIVDGDVEATSGDPVAAVSRGRPLVVNRLSFDNIQVLDPARRFLTSIQFSTGNGSNPHDALMVGSSKMYIPRYGPSFDDLLIADLSKDPVALVGSIDLAPYATNVSGTPRPDRLVETNGLVMVTLQNIDTTFFDYGPGRAVFVDPRTDSVVKAITLEGQNPMGPPSIHPVNGDIYLADAGIFQGTRPRELTGGIEVIDPISLTTRGILVDDDALGGNVSGVAVTSERRGYAVVVTETGKNMLVAFDPVTGADLGTILLTPAYIPEIRSDGDGYLLVAEYDISDPRLRIIDGATGGTIARLSLPRPPASMAILTRDLIVAE